MSLETPFRASEVHASTRNAAGMYVWLLYLNDVLHVS